MNTIVNDLGYDPVLFNSKVSSTEKNKKVGEEVESLFIYQLLKEMDKSVHRDEDSLFYSRYEDTYMGMFHQEVAREIARGEGIGIKQLIEDEIEQQENSVYPDTKG